jgi:hypothetical protein
VLIRLARCEIGATYAGIPGKFGRGNRIGTCSSAERCRGAGFTAARFEIGG